MRARSHVFSFPWLDHSGRFSLFKLIVFLSLWLPGLQLYFQWQNGDLGPRPFDELNHETGLWAIRFLFLSLAVTPLRQLAKNPRLIMVRRMLGLASFAYALAHVIFYLGDLQWDWLKAGTEIVSRFYLFIGLIAMIGLLLLSITSTDAALRWIGGKKWQLLHYSVYGISALVLLHFLLQSRLNLYQPFLFAGFFAWLMVYRVLVRGKKQHPYWIFLVLALCVALFSMLFEASWYQFGTQIQGIRVFLANFRFHGLLRPSWWVLFVGLALAVLPVLREKIVIERRKIKNDGNG